MLPKQSHQWWGTYQLPENTQAICKVGPMLLCVQRFAKEWRIGYRSSREEAFDEQGQQIVVGKPLTEFDSQSSVTRFSARQTTDRLVLVPALADRAVVTRPEGAFFIPPGEETLLFVTTPLWARVEVGEPLRTLQEMPIFRPSDTWFGPSSLEGELCYASRTHGHTDLTKLSFRPHRAITPVSICNLSEEALLLERMNLPVPYLSLFSSENDYLWTQAVTFTREKGGDVVSLKFDKQPPREAVSPTLLSGPRKEADRNLIVRAFGALFSS